jgi:hypothetical protein
MENISIRFGRWLTDNGHLKNGNIKLLWEEFSTRQPKYEKGDIVCIHDEFLWMDTIQFDPYWSYVKEEWIYFVTDNKPIEEHLIAYKQ